MKAVALYGLWNYNDSCQSHMLLWLLGILVLHIDCWSLVYNYFIDTSILNNADTGHAILGSYYYIIRMVLHDMCLHAVDIPCIMSFVQDIVNLANFAELSISYT